jgi:hypothetical protein
VIKSVFSHPSGNPTSTAGNFMVLILISRGEQKNRETN